MPHRGQAYSPSPRWLALIELAIGRFQRLRSGDLFGREISSCLLRFNFNMSIRRNEVRRDGYAFADLYPRLYDGVILHIRHRHKTIDTHDAEPVQHVWHQLLEPRVLNTGNAFGSLEIRCRPGPGLPSLPGL